MTPNWTSQSYNDPLICLNDNRPKMFESIQTSRVARFGLLIHSNWCMLILRAMRIWFLILLWIVIDVWRSISFLFVQVIVAVDDLRNYLSVVDSYLDIVLMCQKVSDSNKMAVWPFCTVVYLACIFCLDFMDECINGHCCLSATSHSSTNVWTYGDFFHCATVFWDVSQNCTHFQVNYLAFIMDGISKRSSLKFPNEDELESLQSILIKILDHFISIEDAIALVNLSQPGRFSIQLYFNLFCAEVVLCIFICRCLISHFCFIFYPTPQPPPTPLLSFPTSPVYMSAFAL